MSDLLAKVPTEYLDRIPDFVLYPDPERYFSDNFVTFDLETKTQGHERSPEAIWPENSIVDASWVCGWDGEVHNIYGNELEMGPLVEAIERADFVVAHNGKFDLKWMLRAGIDLSKVLLYDTMIGEYVFLANRKGNLKLDYLCQREMGYGKKHFIAACMGTDVCPSDMPRSKLIQRADEDVLMTRELFGLQRDFLHKHGLLRHVYTRCLLSCPLADIEMKGVYLDRDAVVEEYDKSMMALAHATQQMDEFTGGVNPKSPKQMKEYIYDVLKFKPKMRGKGKRATPVWSTKTEDILALKATTKKQKEFQQLKAEFARHDADVGKNLEFFYGVVTDPNSDEPLFYAKFNQCVTVTHRLSSTGIKRVFSHMLDDKGKPITKSIQLQNSPRKYKPLYKARHEGWKMGEADGSQLEFRVAAFLGRCPVATQDIVNNKDVHTQTATVITDNGQAMDRQEAKSHTFKPLYGGKSGTDAEVAYYQWFQDTYWGVGEAQQEWKDEAVARHTVTLPHGFIFHFPWAKLKPGGYVEGETNICNYPVQHFATGEIIPIAVVMLWHMMKDMESFLVNTVHDSAISELHPDEVDEYHEISKHAFTHLVYHYLKELYDVEFNVPLGVGVKVGDNWGKGKEFKCAPMPPYEMDGIDYSKLLTEWIEDK